ncbi:MAG: 3-deoxy-7-phosphoheptulonate synthase [Candidatus Riflebacteria bacterium]|nr:3-deoxy-7-phosphoheptulonate synthase [Candidatus Riflebacteria bacterium]
MSEADGRLLVTGSPGRGRRVVKVGDVHLGAGELVVMAGPCAVESQEQILSTARAVKAAGARVLRGGAYKPRTSPYTFQGLGEEGLRLLDLARKETGLAIVTEAIDATVAEKVAAVADIVQIGSRNMANYGLLKMVAGLGKPVLLKRGMSATIKEFLLAAEYVLLAGNPDVILCERGIRTFENSTRFTLDLSAVPVMREQTDLPIIVDPSHAAGRYQLVAPLARAAVAVGADGLIIEVHPDRARALSDGPQALDFHQFQELTQELLGV